MTAEMREKAIGPPAELRDEDVYRLNETVWRGNPAESIAEAKRRLGASRGVPTPAMIDAAYDVLRGALNHQGDYARVEAALRAALTAPEPEPDDGPAVERCDSCDGCGWYEGGKTLKTTCEKCGGTGIRPRLAVPIPPEEP